VFVYLWLPYMILPIFAGLERIPNSLLEASADLGGKGWITFRTVIFPLTVPAIAAGSIFTFSLTLGDYIVPGLVSTTQFIGNVIFVNVAQEPAAAAALLIGAARDHADLPVHRAPLRRIRCPVNSGRAARVGLRLATAFVLAFVYLPLTIVVLYAFNKSGTNAWPPAGFTLEWFADALDNTGLQQAFLTSVLCAIGATIIALVLGCLISLAVSRYQWFRARQHLVRDPAADRFARHRDGDGPIDDVRLTQRATRHPDGDRRARDVLHRARLQQRDRPVATDVTLLRGGVGGPRRACLPDIPVRDVPVAPVRPAGRRTAGVRPVVR
jgi:ABC-type spermidine/putrescine transport system permease subunit I